MGHPALDHPRVRGHIALVRDLAGRTPNLLNGLPLVASRIGDQSGWRAAGARVKLATDPELFAGVSDELLHALATPDITKEARRLALLVTLAVAARTDPATAGQLAADCELIVGCWTRTLAGGILPEPLPAAGADACPGANAVRLGQPALPAPGARAVPDLETAGAIAAVWATGMRFKPPQPLLDLAAVAILVDALRTTAGFPFRRTVRGSLEQLFSEYGARDTLGADGFPHEGTWLFTAGAALVAHAAEHGDSAISTAEGRRALDVLAEPLSWNADRCRRAHRLLVKLAEPEGDTSAEPAYEFAGSTSLPDLLAELDALPGLAAVKTVVREQVATAAVNAERARRGLPAVPMNRHMVFTGEPGTGKTTVARLIGRIYAAMGLLTKGQLVETDRAGLIGQYLGSTVAKTKQVLTSAAGGVLFIDEAYALIEQGFAKGDAYGAEAVNTLVKHMEDERDNLIVILAGYPEQMDEFIATNPGLSSRIGRTVTFASYTADELVEVLGHIAAGQHLTLDGDALAAAAQVFTDRRDTSFGNGRGARNLLEGALAAQAVRLADRVGEASDDELGTLTGDDVRAAAGRLGAAPEAGKGIGFLAAM